MKCRHQLFLIVFGIQPAYAEVFYELLPVVMQQGASARISWEQQDVRHIWRSRVGLGFASGFAVGCADMQQQVIPQVLGLSVAAGLSYGLWLKKTMKERDWLDIASAYVVGLFVGRLANKTTHYCVDYVRSVFNKPEARVVVTADESE